MKKIILVLFVLAVAGGGVGYFVAKNSKKSDSNNQQQVSAKANLSFSEDKKTISFNGIEGKSALDALKESTTVEITQDEFGDTVTSINGTKANPATDYWAFYVNDILSNDPPATYVAKNGDKFKWVMESF